MGDLVLTSRANSVGFFSFENFKSLVWLLIFTVLFRWSVMSPYVVPTASMESTIKVGDRLLANKLAYDFKLPFTSFVIMHLSDVKRGDIIVFRNPTDPSVDYIKRVVAIAGDRICIRNNILYINGIEQKREAFDFDRSSLVDIADVSENKLLFRENLDGRWHWVLQQKVGTTSSDWPVDGEAKVISSDSVFVIGDNRSNSSDSREWGEVPLSYVHGKALLVLWSAFSPRGSWLKFRWGRFGHVLDSDVPIATM